MRIDKPEVKQQIVFSPIDSSASTNNSIFLDTSDNVIKKKDNTGTVSAIGGTIVPELPPDWWTNSAKYTETVNTGGTFLTDWNFSGSAYHSAAYDAVNNNSYITFNVPNIGTAQGGTIDLKTAISINKALSMGVNLNLSSSDGTAYGTFNIGNATDGWTQVFTQSIGQSLATACYGFVEVIKNLNGTYKIILNSEEIVAALSLPNGVKLQCSIGSNTFGNYTNGTLSIENLRTSITAAAPTSTALDWFVTPGSYTEVVDTAGTFSTYWTRSGDGSSNFNSGNNSSYSYSNTPSYNSTETIKLVTSITKTFTFTCYSVGRLFTGVSIDSQVYVGNDTDGWTSVYQFSGGVCDNLTTTPTTVTCIKNNNGTWKIISGNIVVQAALSLPNGMKIQGYATHSGTNTTSAWTQTHIKNLRKSV